MATAWVRLRAPRRCTMKCTSFLMVLSAYASSWAMLAVVQPWARKPRTTRSRGVNPARWARWADASAWWPVSPPPSRSARAKRSAPPTTAPWLGRVTTWWRLERRPAACNPRRASASSAYAKGDTDTAVMVLLLSRAMSDSTVAGRPLPPWTRPDASSRGRAPLSPRRGALQHCGGSAGSIDDGQIARGEHAVVEQVLARDRPWRGCRRRTSRCQRGAAGPVRNACGPRCPSTRGRAGRRPPGS